MVDIDSWIEIVKKVKWLPEDNVSQLCTMAKEILMEEPNVINVNSPVVVCGNIHGQFPDLIQLFSIGGELPKTNYLFLGDYVDRGYYSVETFTLLLLLKVRYPDKMTLLRGNHESRQISQVYGFYNECDSKYGNSHPWREFCSVFDCLNISALIDGRIFCVHGGLSPEIVTIDQIQRIFRFTEIPREGAFDDLLDSAPDESSESWSLRGRHGWFFGSQIVNEFAFINKIDLICRAHQLVSEGYKIMFEERNCITIFTAPNYCYRCGNMAAIMNFDRELNYEFKVFESLDNGQLVNSPVNN